MADIVTAIAQLGTFDHAACDAVLRSRHISVQGITWTHPSAYVALIVNTCGAVLFEIVALGGTFAAYRARTTQPDDGTTFRSARRVVLPLVAAFGVLLIGGQANAIADYATTCRALLATP